VTSDLVQRVGPVLRADPRRVLARLFVPGHEHLVDQESRATGVLARVLATSEDEACAAVEGLRERYAGRHRDLDAVLREHYAQIAHRVPSVHAVSEAQQNLIGAVFTSEYALEAAALFNPSAVSHPDQSRLPAGSQRFVLSLRAVGEGHISSVELRTGVVDAAGVPTMDAPSPYSSVGSSRPAVRHRDLFAAELTEHGADAESASYLVRMLPIRFDDAALENALAALVRQRVTRHGGVRTAELARRLSLSSYETTFPAEVPLCERVLWPFAPTESQGIEDVRLVRFVDAGGTVDYRGTYTAFDGERVSPRVLATTDFTRFTMSSLAGPAARDKGMALFPRLVGGRHLALSRWDRESIAVASSRDGRWWGDAVTLDLPGRVWQLVQSGNCGPPIETAAGWLVLTHGVGPIREYALGAVLLDLDDPTRVLGSLAEPLLRVAADERDGYVPNVVYSCGALLHGDYLLLPYGASDATVRFATVDLPGLLSLLVNGT
jgi:predicted GH43/DUF377 family glycosyl hydrolase